MFARVTAFRMNPDSEDEVVAMLDDIRAQVAKIDGVILSYTMWNDDGTGQTIAIYENETAADAALSMVQQVWAGLASHLLAAPEMTSYSKVEKIAG